MLLPFNTIGRLHTYLCYDVFSVDETGGYGKRFYGGVAGEDWKRFTKKVKEIREANTAEMKGLEGNVALEKENELREREHEIEVGRTLCNTQLDFFDEKEKKGLIPASEVLNVEEIRETLRSLLA